MGRQGWTHTNGSEVRSFQRRCSAWLAVSLTALVRVCPIAPTVSAPLWSERPRLSSPVRDPVLFAGRFQISRLWVRFLPGVLQNPAGKPRVLPLPNSQAADSRNRVAECCRQLGPTQTDWPY